MGNTILIDNALKLLMSLPSSKKIEKVMIPSFSLLMICFLGLHIHISFFCLFNNIIDFLFFKDPYIT